MNEVQLEQLVTHYDGQFRKELMLHSRSLDQVKGQLEGQLTHFFLTESQISLHHRAIDQAHAKLLTRFKQIEYMQETSVKDLNNDNWYAGPAEEAPIWNQLVEQLRSAGRSDEEIRDVDGQSTAILSLAHRPEVGSFRSQGVVVGHVQSGKTGNMSAVIAKAADTPYRFFLVLSGLTDALRAQTQVRFNQDLGADDKSFWHSWTTESDDFSEPITSGFQFNSNLRQLAVLKKNKDVLQRFLDKLKQTPLAVLKTMPFLVIDDECDQASTNSAKIKEEMTRINSLIRQILDVLPRVSYIGYTATPYANVLVNPMTEDGQMEDLYPKDFIYAMTPPDAYFGAERLFGREALTGEMEDSDSDSYDGLDMIRSIPEDEAKILMPSQKAIASMTSYPITHQLDRALKYYLLALAARAVRGQGQRHSSMLINTSHRVPLHFLIAEAVTRWLRDLQNRLSAHNSRLLSELEELWTAESNRIDSSQFNLEAVPFSALIEKLPTELASVEIIVENGPSEQRMDYRQEARKYIVIGGNVVSRGLTIEGLVVSFFLRTASQYDTLMQMGRWFGYRQGYEDLPRIWMEEPMRHAFRSLAMVEAEIRNEIRLYHEKQLTPLQFAVKIRKLPGMLITARNKMHFANIAHVSYAGRHMQTFRFNRNDLEWLQSNWSAGSKLLSSIHGTHTPQLRGSNRVYLDVPVESLLEFFASYKAHEKQEDMSSEPVMEYIQKRLEAGDPRYSQWNLAVMIPSKSAGPSEFPLGPLGTVGTAIRSSLTDSSHDTADIKALMSLKDLTIDIPENVSVNPTSWKAVRNHRDAIGMSPLLLLYPINRLSQPAGTGDKRFPLAAASDVLGMGVWFPSAKDSDDAHYVSVALPDIDHEEDEFYQEMENELARTSVVEPQDA